MNILSRLKIRQVSLLRQLIITFSIGFGVLSMLSSFAISTLTYQIVRDKWIAQGWQATEAFAAQSALALLYSSKENAEEPARIMLDFPDVIGVSIYNALHQELFHRGEQLRIKDDQSQWPLIRKLIKETDDAWYFVGPVFVKPGSESNASPFEENLFEPELIGHVVLTVSKQSLNSMKDRILLSLLIVAAGSAILFMLFLLGMLRRLTMPLKQLASIMGEASAGEKHVRANLKGSRDIVEMGEAFNSMMGVLETRESQLECARDTAIESARIKGEFAANVSHELRTPLNAVLGMLELLQDTRLTAKQMDYVMVAINAAELLLKLIEDILDFSRIESGKMKTRPVDFILKDILDEVIKLMIGQAHRKGLQLHYSIADYIPMMVRGEAAFLRQVLVNLIGNAIKFTENGEIRIDIIEEKLNANSMVLRFNVIDTGIGIPVLAQTAIFDAFVQVDGASTRQHDGAGLGLAICRQLVQLMGGEIGVASEVEQGSTFWFSMPFEPVMDAKALAMHMLNNNDDNQSRLHCFLTDESNCIKSRILIVDDNLTSQMVASGMLKRLGYSFDVAACGIEALEYLEKQSYGLILMDCQMPGMDGFETTRRIRLMPEPINRVPIVAITASAQQGDSDLCFAAGMNDYIAKPIRKHILRYKLLLWLKGDTIPDSFGDDNAQRHDDDCVSLDTLALISMRDELGSVFCNIVNIYFEDTLDQIDKIGCAIETKNTDQLREYAHSLKGASINMFAERMSMIAKKLEDNGKLNALEGCDILLDQLREEYFIVERMMKQAINIGTSEISA